MAARRTNKSEQAPAMPKYLQVFVTENYQGNDGEEKTSYTRVGAAFPHRKGCGFNIEITEGISVSGQLVALPPRPRSPRSSPRRPRPSGSPPSQEVLGEVDRERRARAQRPVADLPRRRPRARHPATVTRRTSTYSSPKVCAHSSADAEACALRSYNVGYGDRNGRDFAAGCGRRHPGPISDPADLAAQGKRQHRASSCRWPRPPRSPRDPGRTCATRGGRSPRRRA